MKQAVPRIPIPCPVPLLLLLLLATSGCASTAFKRATLPTNLEMRALVRADPKSPFAWGPKDKQVAFTREGLRVTTLDGKQRLLDPESPTAIAWSPDGTLLVAAFPGGKDAADTRLRIVDSQGSRLAEAQINGRVEQLFWPEELRILAGAAELKTYSFGANLKTTLYRWNGRDTPAATALRESTLGRPIVEALGARLIDSFFVSLSALGTEILYAQAVHPPAFPARLDIILRHLETGIERHLASVSLTGSGAVFSADSERILFANNATQSSWMDLWTGKKSPGVDAVGWSLAQSPGGRYLWLDGRLFLDDQQVGSVPSAGAARFSSDGSMLLAQRGPSLVLLSGFRDPGRPSLAPGQRSELTTMRRLLFQELISREEYLSSKSKVTTP